MFCYKCGTKLEDDAVFCYNCGASQQDEVKVNKADNSNRAQSAFTGSATGAPTLQYNNSQTTVSQKSKKGLFVGLAVGVAVALLLVIILIVNSNSGDDDYPYIPSDDNYYAPTINDTTTTIEESYEQEIIDSIDKSKVYVSEGNFIEALAVLDTAEQLYGRDTRIEEQKKAVNVAKLLYDVSLLENEKNYVKAIECIENSAETTKYNADVIQKLNSLKILYKNHVLTQAEGAFKSSGYKAAIDVLNESLKYLSNNEEVNAAIKRYEEYIPVSVAELEYFTGNDFALVNNVKDNLGNIHDNVVYPVSKGWSNASTTNIYKINKQYSCLSGTWFQFYDYRTEVKYGMGANDYTSKLEIYGDGILVYSGAMKAGVEPQNIDLNISGVTELKIFYFGGGSNGSYSGIADFNVQK